MRHYAFQILRGLTLAATLGIISWVAARSMGISSTTLLVATAVTSAALLGTLARFFPGLLPRTLGIAGASLRQGRGTCFTSQVTKEVDNSDAELKPVSDCVQAETTDPEDVDPQTLVASMLAAGRGALLLKPVVANTLPLEQRRQAEQQFEDCMSLVPAGPVILTGHGTEELCQADRLRSEHHISLPNFYLDRTPVTNRQYLEFVNDGGYENLSLWDQTLWPAVLRFTDLTGQSGPRYWKDGTYPDGQDDHPVVGVCWYEATAYARWAGKRLPTDPEWVRAAAWPMEPVEGQTQQLRYPWGDACEHERANLWHSDNHQTKAVGDFPLGDNPCGIRQLIGNVWEWTSSDFGCWDPSQLRLETEVPMKSLRGGAYDTYFEAQAQAQFQSGDSPLARKENIGFRCAATFTDILWLAPANQEGELSTKPGATAREPELTGANS